ncbi:glycoside hydrolase family 16 protein [Actinomadura yumaensis]|uniref:Glycoside hydrolase family 16 protein n=1 Tax=Actinomadura yumaensis TaxID=111807 RepID=A0ABW2CTS0_9ACTN
MRTHLAAVAAVAALGGALTGYLAAPSPGGADARRAASSLAAGPRHLALNMPAGDRAKAAGLGYDLFDVDPDEDEIASLPKGAKAMLWVGNTTCGDFEIADTGAFAETVERLADDPRVYGWYLSDEPNPKECPGIAAKIRERADIVHERAPGQKAFASLTDWEMSPLRPSETHLDLIGVDPYPCRVDGDGCDLGVIDRMVRQADAAGFPRRMIVPVFQTFGQTCADGEKTWRMPRPAQLRAMLDRWDRHAPSPAFDVSYSWGRQDAWACPALADHPELQAVMKAHNTRRRGPAPASPPTRGPGGGPSRSPGGGTSGWGRPVVSEDFDGTEVDTSKWLVYDSPAAKVNPRTAKATTVKDGMLHLTGGLYDGKDLSGGIASHLNQRYGRWEVRMRADAGTGYSAVALLWPEHFGRPEKAEINFAEVIDPTRKSTGLFVHQGENDAQAQRTVKVDFTRWHTVALDWRPEKLVFWIDGRKVWTYTGPLLPKQTKMGLALQNDQVCDRGKGFCRTRDTPKWVTMNVDWVRVYGLPGDSPPSSEPRSPSPTPTASPTSCPVPTS